MHVLISRFESQYPLTGLHIVFSKMLNQQSFLFKVEYIADGISPEQSRNTKVAIFLEKSKFYRTLAGFSIKYNKSPYNFGL
jgi:hypothetical protein